MTSPRIAGIDHVSLPMRDTNAMVAFYRSLGFDVVERTAVVSVHAGSQMVNLHRPEIWQREGFTLRAPAAVPACGDLCFRWEGSVEELQATLERAGVPIEDGPVARRGAIAAEGRSIYVRDPDGNLVEFLVYES